MLEYFKKHIVISHASGLTEISQWLLDGLPRNLEHIFIAYKTTQILVMP